jgi:hypothetical protein
MAMTKLVERRLLEKELEEVLKLPPSLARSREVRAIVQMINSLKRKSGEGKTKWIPPDLTSLTS